MYLTISMTLIKVQLTIIAYQRRLLSMSCNWLCNPMDQHHNWLCSQQPNGSNKVKEHKRHYHSVAMASFLMTRNLCKLVSSSQVPFVMNTGTSCKRAIHGARQGMLYGTLKYRNPPPQHAVYSVDCLFWLLAISWNLRDSFCCWKSDRLRKSSE